MEFDGLDINYSTHVQGHGWMDWVSNGEISGVPEEQKRIEAIQIKLSGEQAEAYDVYYRVHSQSLGWLAWAKNGDKAGTEGLTKRIEAIEVVILEKGADTAATEGTAFVSADDVAPEEEPSVRYSAHVQSHGWMDSVKDGALAGTTNQAKRLEAFKVNLEDISGLGVQYRAKAENHGWMNWVADGSISGTIDQAKRLEAVQIQLTGKKAADYDIYYRLHVQSHGWLGWAKNGEKAGTSESDKRVEAIEIQLVEKGGAAPGSTKTPYIETVSVSYSSHVQKDGWLPAVKDGEVSGTEGQSKRLEAIKVELNDFDNLGIQYSTHVQSLGWTNWVGNGAVSGTVGQGKRVEALKVQLTGSAASSYDVYYRVHSEKFGWSGWAKNGEPAGTEGYGYQAEAFEVKVLPKNTPMDTSRDAFRKFTHPSIIYRSHVQRLGWMAEQKDGSLTGTTGQKKQIEAFQVRLENLPYKGGISYRTYVEGEGWTSTVTNGQTSGTTGKGKHLEAVVLNLTGQMAEHYDVYYRVHVEKLGWLGWAKNGMKAGSEGHRKQIEAMEIKLFKKGSGPSVNGKDAFQQRTVIYLDAGHGGADGGATYSNTMEKDLNLSVTKKLQSRLENMGYTVLMSRTGNENLSLYERAQDANNKNPDIFISIHHNAMPGNSTVQGIETYYYQYDPGYPSKINKEYHNDPIRLRESAKLANEVHKALIKESGAIDRGVRSKAFAVVRETSMPAILLELGYMSSPLELRKLRTSAYQNALADGLAQGIHNYFN